jgi:transposase
MLDWSKRNLTKMTDRLYPINEEFFNLRILPIIMRHTSISGGRPPKISHYTCLCAMLKMLSISIPWRDCPKEYGPWHTIYTRFKRWSENGLLWNIFFELKQEKHIEMNIVFMDSTTVKVHRHGLGARKKRGPQSISKNVAGNGTKIHVILAANEPISIQLTGANVHDSEPTIPMLVPLEKMGIKRFVADKGYDDDKIRAALTDYKIKADIPPRKNRKEYRFYDNTVYKWRWRVEAFFGKIKEHRRLALR